MIECHLSIDKSVKGNYQDKDLIQWLRFRLSKCREQDLHIRKQLEELLVILLPQT